MLDDLVAIIVVGLAMLVPIIAIMTTHQRKMAELYRTSPMQQPIDPRLALENEQLKKELADMKAMLYEQAIAIDNLSSKPNATSEISERLENTSK